MATLREAHRERTTTAIVDAALELFAAHGRDEVTMGAIASAAGIGERTLYRYFVDKDDILFSWDGQAPEGVTQTIAERPAKEPPLDTISAALEAASSPWESQRDRMVLRARIIADSPHLRDREAAKMAAISAAVAQALVDRGVAIGAARLLASVGTAAFSEGTRRWLEEDEAQPLSTHVQAALTQARSLLSSSEN